MPELGALPHLDRRCRSRSLDEFNDAGRQDPDGEHEDAYQGAESMWRGRSSGISGCRRLGSTAIRPLRSQLLRSLLLARRALLISPDRIGARGGL